MIVQSYSDDDQLASNHRDIFEALLTAYADIGEALPRFDRYEKAFKDNLEFQNVLASVYSGILDFHQRAYTFFRRRGLWSHTLIDFVRLTPSQLGTYSFSHCGQILEVDLAALSRV